MSKYVKCIYNNHSNKVLILDKVYKVLDENTKCYRIEYYPGLSNSFHKTYFEEVDSHEFHLQSAQTIVNKNTYKGIFGDVIDERHPWNDLYKSVPAPNLPAGTVIAAKECSHQWKNYLGFTETYEYCVKCNAKKE